MANSKLLCCHVCVHLQELDDISRIVSAERYDKRVLSLQPYFGPNAHKTMLTEWFVINQEYEDARCLRYLNFPSEWTWDSSDRVWTRRRRKQKLDDRIGCIYHVGLASFFPFGCEVI